MTNARSIFELSCIELSSRPRRYTYYALEFLETVKQDSKKTMAEFLAVCPKRLCISTVGTRTDLFARDPKKVGPPLETLRPHLSV